VHFVAHDLDGHDHLLEERAVVERLEPAQYVPGGRCRMNPSWNQTMVRPSPTTVPPRSEDIRIR
jgi:hypothetical protein